MKKLIFIVFFTLFIPYLVHAETLSLTTYYPAPFGVYNQLRLVPQAAAPACAGLDGLLWVNSTGELKMCMGGVSRAASGVWEQDVASPPNVYLTEDNPPGVNIKVGVGTVTPARKLHVRDIALQALRLDSTSGTGVEMELFEGVTRRGIVGASAAEALYVIDSAGATKRFVVQQSGEAGVGVIDPLVELHVKSIGAGNGDIAVDSSDNFRWTMSSLQTSGRWVLNRNIPGSHIAIIAEQNGTILLATDPVGGANNRVGIGTGNTTPTAPLDVQGNARIKGDLVVSTTGFPGGTGNVTAHAFFYVSDEKMKENIHPAKGLETIMKLNGVEFDWKGTDKKGVGLIAQDVEKVLPDLVETASGTDLKGVQYGNLVAPLIEAIKEQQQQIESLKKEIEALKAKQF